MGERSFAELADAADRAGSIHNPTREQERLVNGYVSVTYWLGLPALARVSAGGSGFGRRRCPSRTPGKHSRNSRARTTSRSCDCQPTAGGPADRVAIIESVFGL